MVSLKGLLVQWDTDKLIEDDNTGDKGDFWLSAKAVRERNACEGAIECSGHITDENVNSAMPEH